MMTEIRTIAPQITRSEAVEQTARTSAWSYLQRRVRTWSGTASEPTQIQQVFYPNYIAYTTVTIPRRFASDRVEKFLGGIDGRTTHSGAIDFELPDRTRQQVTPDHVLSPDVGEDDAQVEWRDWVFEYVSRKFRPVRRPDFNLDSLELLYIPYWIVEFDDTTYVVNSLTRAADVIETIPPLDDHYQSLSSALPSSRPAIDRHS